MDPPLPSIPLAAPAAINATTISTAAATISSASAATAATSVQPVDSSPRGAPTDGGNADPLPPVPGAKLRLMCSYGGHIMPRPHDKALTYVSGDTRLVVVDRHSSLATFCSRLSRTLLNGRSFTLKYQLPSEDLDSLVSITSDEDLENMIDEYDRVTSSLASASTTQRIRLFLFANKLETAATMGSLLDDAKSETWFVDALNGSGLLPRGLSDSVAVDNCLVNLDNVSGGGDADAHTIETNVNGENNNKKQGDSISNAVLQHEMQLSSMPDFPMVETASSSFGSSSSSPSMANLPPIRVRVSEEQRMEEQFAQMSFSNVHMQRQIDDGVGVVAARPPMIPPPAMAEAVAAAAGNNAVVDAGGATGTACGRALSDDERSDPGLPAGYRKPPLPLQPVVVQPRAGGGYSFPSPDSVASDSSISSATSFSMPMYYQDQAQAQPRVPGSQPDSTPIQTSHVQAQSVHYPNYTTTTNTLEQHQQPPVQQSYLHHNVQYFHHPSSYYQVYAHQVDPHHQHQPQNYPVYVMPVAQSQQFVSMQSNNADIGIIPSSRPLTPPPPSSTGTPPLYPNSKPVTNSKPEIAPSVYRTTVTSSPQVVQVQQPQYVGYNSQVPHHAAPNAGYGYEYQNMPNEPAYYQAASTPLVSQYQSMTPAAAAAALADVSKQMGMDSSNLPQITTSQPM